MSDLIAPKGEPTAKDLRRSTDRRVVRTRKAIREAFFKLMENPVYCRMNSQVNQNAIRKAMQDEGGR